MIRTSRFVVLITCSLLVLSACGSGGLSQKEQEAYAKELEYAEGRTKRTMAAWGKTQELAKQYIGILPDSIEATLKKYDETVSRLVSYRSCLTQYQEIKEPFAKAKTACMQRSGLDSYID